MSRIERGKLDELSVVMIRRVSATLDIRVEWLPRSRHADVDRLANARHAAFAEFVVAWLASLPGWVARPEVSFSVYGDRGIVDIVGWHEGARALLLIELKTEIVDVAEILGTIDRKVRRGREIAEPFSWRPRVIGTALLIGDSMVNRNRVRSHTATFRAALPDDGRALRAWLREPIASLRALRFVSNARHRGVRSGFSAPRRVRVKPRVPS